VEKFDVNKYKFDDRSKEQFIRDLKEGLAKEVQAINIFKEILKNSVIENPEVIYIGSEKEGEVIFEGNEVANVDLFPDYLLKFKKNRRARVNFIEVKVCNPQSQFAYFKKKQLEQYSEIHDVAILFVMGISTENPKFILVTPEQILNLGIAPELIYGKETYKAHISLFNWEKFEAYDRRYSVVEKSYIKER
jgi:hypothetical protein